MSQQSYEEIAKQVNYELSKYDDESTFEKFSKVDKKLRMRSGAAFEYSGYKDYFDYYFDDT
jgi:hypothetical protein